MRNYKELLISLLVGAILGVIAKYLDTVPYIDDSILHRVGNFLGDLFTRLGVWVFIAIIIALKARTLASAALNTLLFFTGMLLTYYLYSAYLFGFFPTKYFFAWGKIALLSPILAILAHLGKHDQNLRNILPALPIGLITFLSLSFGFLYVSVIYIPEFIMLLVTGKLYYRNPKQFSIVITLSILVAILLKEFSPIAF